MTYTTSQNIKTRTTYMAAALFATLIDLVYIYDAERDIVFIEAPIHQRTAW